MSACSVGSWLVPFIGIPYVSKGCSLHGCDCWGLYRLLTEERTGDILPDYHYTDADDVDSVTGALKAIEVEWQRLEQPEAGAGLLFKIKGEPVHIGYCIDPIRKTMLHSLKGHNSAIESYDTGKWNRRLEGAYRWLLA